MFLQLFCKSEIILTQKGFFKRAYGFVTNIRIMVENDI